LKDARYEKPEAVKHFELRQS